MVERSRGNIRIKRSLRSTKHLIEIRQTFEVKEASGDSAHFNDKKPHAGEQPHDVSTKPEVYLCFSQGVVHLLVFRLQGFPQLLPRFFSRSAVRSCKELEYLSAYMP